MVQSSAVLYPAQAVHQAPQSATHPAQEAAIQKVTPRNGK